jgi:CRP/FNR family transcriptional regulator
MKGSENLENICDYCQHDLCIKRVPVFAPLEINVLEEIVPYVMRRNYARGSLIVHEGDLLTSLYIINKGSVKAFKTSLQGKEQILYVFAEGDFFGESYLFNNEESGYSIEALEEVQICTLEKSHFQNFLLANPEVALKIIEELGRRINLLEINIQSMGVRSVDTRVAALLLEYLEKFSFDDATGPIIQLPLSREGMANSLGIARETLSRKLTALEQQGYIQSVGNKALRVIDKSYLEKMAGR